MQQGKSYIRDSEDFLSKIRNFTSIPDGSFLVTVDVVGPYSSIPHSAGLSALKEVRYSCSAHLSVYLFIIARSSHGHIKRKQPQRIQYSCSVTMINIVKKYL